MIPAEAKQRKACLNCYNKKVRCHLDSQQSLCTRCAQDGVPCEFPDENLKPMRHSIRENVQSLTARVQTLEEAFLGAEVSARAKSTTSHTPGESTSQTNGISTSIGDNAAKESVKTYRGPNSPWSLLVGGAKSELASPDQVQFVEGAARLADDDRSSTISTIAPSFDALGELHRVGRDDVIRYLSICDENCPFPILHFEAFVQIVAQMLDTNSIPRSGQMACIFVYMAFGAAQSVEVPPETNQLVQSGVFFNNALRMLPNLISESDIWALKALTLMIHYLQASSKPQQCWNLLGMALRMAITLGFHRNEPQDSYSAIEMEEGNRAWWLCYIMDKYDSSLLRLNEEAKSDRWNRSLCATFGYPSMIDKHLEKSAIRLPTLFQQRLGSTGPTSEAKDQLAVDFFEEMIELSQARDLLLESEKKSSYSVHQDLPEALHMISRQSRPRSPVSSPLLSLQRDISDLAHHNAAIVVLTYLVGLSPPHTDCITHARRTINLITSAKTVEHTMCLWMWLYYGFTAAVVLFLHSLTEISHEEVIIDLALLSKLERVCTSLATKGSNGSQRLKEILEMMEKLLVNTMKTSAMNTSRAKRELGVELGDGSRQPKEKMPRIAAGASVLARNPVDTTRDLETTRNLGTEFLDDIPQSFSWDEWDHWLTGSPLDPNLEE